MGICVVVFYIMDEKVNVGFDFDWYYGLVKIIFYGFFDLFILGLWRFVWKRIKLFIDVWNKVGLVCVV